jgi:hypothetical protein
MVMAIESFWNKKSGIVYEFIKDVNSDYGQFKNVSTGKINILSKDGCEFQKDHFYMFEPKNILTSFGHIGSPVVYKQTWKMVSYP